MTMLDAEERELAITMLQGIMSDDLNWSTNARRLARKLQESLQDPLEGVTIEKASEIERYKQYLLRTPDKLTAEQANHMLLVLKARFPTNTFAFATGGISVAEPRPENVYTPVVMQDELVEALTRGMQVLDERWTRAQDPGVKSGYAAAKAALAVLRDELTPERDGAATPPAATTGAATPAADESATGVAPPAAAPSPYLGVGAVVRTDLGVFVRRVQNDHRDRVWWRVPDGDWFTPSEIGDMSEVLSRGVLL